MTERRFTEKECVENGGHFWKEWWANSQVDENFNRTGLEYAVYYANGEPLMRGYPLCGRIEKQNVEWEEVK